MPQNDDLPRVTRALLAQREAFKAFLIARLGNPVDAEDVLQNTLVKALQHADEVRDSERAVAWFYRVLRRALVDHVRSRSASLRRENAWASDPSLQWDQADAERQICACIERLLPALKPAHATLLRRVDLEGESVASAAAALAVTPNHASVTLHRARAELRTKLTAFCRDCSCLEVCECG